MMMKEFTERTKYEPTPEEYRYIEESYYEFDGDKNEFCKAWIKDKKSGKWELEYRLRKALADQKAEYERQLEEKEETISFYRPYFKECRELRKKLDNTKRHMEAIVKDL